MTISLVLPAFKEEKRIEASVRALRNFIQFRPEITEVLYIVEKYPDQTIEIGQAVAQGEDRIHIVDNQVHRGKGFAVKSGMLKAKGDIVIFMDTDLSTSLHEVDRFFRYFQEHGDCDVLIGSRSDVESKITVRQSWLRERMGRVFNLFVQLFAFRGLVDTQCGFKAFRQNAARRVFSLQKTDGFSFDVEILLLAKELGFQVHSLPVEWANDDDSKVSKLRDSVKMFVDVIRMKALVRETLRALPVQEDRDIKKAA